MRQQHFQTTIKQLKKLKIGTFNEDFLLTWEQTDDEIKAVVLVAELFKEMHKAGLSFRAFDTGLAISIFRDKSTRTRFSFASAVNALGLGLSELDEEKSQIAHGETVR
jgi:ornithine carbamoyltransferase